LPRSEKQAEVTHNHPEGIRGAKAIAAVTFPARQGVPRTYRFNESCQETVPQAITAFLESDGYEGAVQLAVSLGRDADTLAPALLAE